VFLPYTPNESTRSQPVSVFFAKSTSFATMGAAPPIRRCMFEKRDFDMAITTIDRVYTKARNRSGIVPSGVVPSDQSYAAVPSLR
jgi:hypothetical protein